MANDEVLGGFIQSDPPLVTATSRSIGTGQFKSGDQTKLRQKNSWPISDSSPEGTGVYINRTTQSSGTITVPAEFDYVFISAAGAGGSGAHDNDCRQQQPGGPGGIAKVLIDCNVVGSRTISFSLGAGGPGRGGNDAPGSGGGSSSVNIGNFNMNLGGGGGGSPNNTGGTGNVNSNGPREAFSQSGVFSNPALLSKGTDAPDPTFTYLNMPTSASGSGARCGEGGSSAPGSNGFIYVRYGGGIDSLTTINNSQDPIGGPASSYTPSYNLDT